MSEQDQSPSTGPEADQERPRIANPGRRRLGGLGVGGAAVAMTVTSRSAVAGWGTCTGSELASGNLSRDLTKANPCGCSPGFWWNNNGTVLWDDVTVAAFDGFRRGAKFNTIFGVSFLTNSNTKLGEVGPSVNPPNTVGATATVAMHAVAALLNAAYYGSRYPVTGLQTPSAVISAFQTAFNTPGDMTAKKKALNDFKDRVDIYGKTKDLWCRGSK